MPPASPCASISIFIPRIIFSLSPSYFHLPLSLSLFPTLSTFRRFSFWRFSSSGSCSSSPELPSARWIFNFRQRRDRGQSNFWRYFPRTRLRATVRRCAPRGSTRPATNASRRSRRHRRIPGRSATAERFVRSFVSPKHRRRIFNEIKFHPKGGSQPTANPFALFHSTLLRAPFRITFRKQAEALQFFKLSMHREFPFRTQPSTRSKSIRSAVCLDVLRSTGRYFLFSIFLSPSSSSSIDTMSFLFSAATLFHRIFFDTRVSLDISVRLSYYPKGKMRYLRCLNVSPVETSPCVGKRGIDNGTTLLGEENFGNRRLFRLASDERAQLVSKIIIRKLD